MKPWQVLLIVVLSIAAWVAVIALANLLLTVIRMGQ